MVDIFNINFETLIFCCVLIVLLILFSVNVIDINNSHITRGHSLTLHVPTSRINCRQHFFAVRVVEVWNSLPEEVISAPRLSVFTFRLKNVNFSRFLVGKL